MRRHSWAVGFVIFTAACVVVQAASDMCNREIYDEQCGGHSRNFLHFRPVKGLRVTTDLTPLALGCLCHVAQYVF